jgi:radical SAM superfamily enzyme YgiQ (UPF0313 family)
MLVMPPNTLPADSVRRIAEPLTLLYLVSPLKNAGFEVKVLDATCEGYDNVSLNNGYLTYGSSSEAIKKQIIEFCPDLVGVNCMFTARENNALAVSRLVKDVSRDILVVMGGLQATLFPQRMIESGNVDYVIMNEGEFRLVNLLNAINEGKTELIFDGVAYKNNGAVKVNPPIGWINDLDSIPLPDRDAIEMQKYFDIGRPYAPFSAERNVAQILCTRGCFNRCNFCSTVYYWGRKVRSRSVGNIMTELELLVSKYNVKEVQIIDDNLTADKKLSRELFIRMKDLKLKWCTPHGLMFNTLDKELIRLMAESGAYQLTFAIESGSKRVLEQIIHKDVRLDMVKEIVEEAHKYDISVHGMLVTGFPGETRQEIMETLDFPFQVGFDSVSLFIVNPLPGSELYDECMQKKYLVSDFNAMDFKSANIRISRNSPDYNMDPEELVFLVDKKTREFNEWAKNAYPQRWKRKFSNYLKHHPEEAEKIMGRVT